MAAELADFLARLEADPGLRFAPVRHHSPACAAWVERLIRDWRPECLLLEAPAEMATLLPWLTDRRTEAPVAAYFYLDSQDGRRSYYPFADFSPEWRALRAMAKTGGTVRCIDLPFGQRAALDRLDRFLVEPEPHYHDERRWRSGFERIAERLRDAAGCADLDHWWDRHFEDGPARIATDFFRDLAAYGWLLRRDGAADESENRAREAWMAREMARARAEGLRCLVLCGAYHLAGLLDPPLSSTEPATENAGAALIPYTLSRLDRYGYAAGVPLPAYYQARWEQRRSAEPRLAAHGELAARLVDSLNRERHPVGSADAIELVAMAERLGTLRGARAGRQEWLEAAASTLDKSAEGPVFLQRCEALLTAPQRGRLPAGLPVPPLVGDFRRELRRWQLSERGERERALDLYRSAQHRQQSHFLRRLAWLEIPFATCRSGPDFAHGRHLHLVREVWRIAGNDELVPALIEASRWGQTLAEAALHKLLDRLAQRVPQQPAVDLVEALQLGLHPLAGELCQRLEHWLRQTLDPLALCRALVILNALARGRRLLGGEDLAGFDRLPPLAFVQTCQHLPLLGQADEAAQELALEALIELVGMVRQGRLPHEQVRLNSALVALYESAADPLLHGAALGGLAVGAGWSEARCGDELCRQLALHQAEPLALAALLRGFLALARTALRWRRDWLDALGRVMRSWDETTFLTALPGLRYAFSQYGRSELRELARGLLGEAEVQAGLPAVDLASVAQAATLRVRLDITLAGWGWPTEAADG
ncbi:DUF5682 family protein [Chitinimonas lacunae]|uniref:DUF5682 family protein n=1 Tax=Chitinimonas lacunae TaxID=1963018 RepID=A0ABV8ML56_9NEIS